MGVRKELADAGSAVGWMPIEDSGNGSGLLLRLDCYCGWIAIVLKIRGTDAGSAVGWMPIVPTERPVEDSGNGSGKVLSGVAPEECCRVVSDSQMGAKRQAEKVGMSEGTTSGSSGETNEDKPKRGK